MTKEKWAVINANHKRELKKWFQSVHVHNKISRHSHTHTPIGISMAYARATCTRTPVIPIVRMNFGETFTPRLWRSSSNAYVYYIHIRFREKCIHSINFHTISLWTIIDASDRLTANCITIVGDATSYWNCDRLSVDYDTFDGLPNIAWFRQFHRIVRINGWVQSKWSAAIFSNPSFGGEAVALVVVSSTMWVHLFVQFLWLFVIVVVVAVVVVVVAVGMA